ncbi:MAG: hypothetical protein A3E79_18780 [Burkholderiales bacterium RIFCSPHIGHO2_12_FULL_61_11]|nr:MAG: hypothetical protein A3E79_18780 [Burkholderiales bacterium RIFCSPHIGHO2_12_FULL_61_11]
MRRRPDIAVAEQQVAAAAARIGVARNRFARSAMTPFPQIAAAGLFGHDVKLQEQGSVPRSAVAMQE